MARGPLTQTIAAFLLEMPSERAAKLEYEPFLRAGGLMGPGIDDPLVANSETLGARPETPSPAGMVAVPPAAQNDDAGAGGRPASVRMVRRAPRSYTSPASSHRSGISDSGSVMS